MLSWGNPQDRRYSSGLDRGILYYDNKVIPWNGLVSITKETSVSSEPVYFEGRKVNDIFTFSSPSYTLTAFACPEEFFDAMGLEEVGPDFYAADQQPQRFSLCYRKSLYDALSQDPIGHEINFLFHMTAIPDNDEANTQSNSSTPSNFSWKLSGIPTPILGFQATCHFKIKTAGFNDSQLEELYEYLYGSEDTDPTHVTPEGLMNLLNSWIDITDNGDGSWTASGPVEFFDVQNGAFKITNVGGYYVDQDTYVARS